MDTLQTPRRRRNIQDLVYVGSGFCNPLDRLAFAFFGIIPIAFKRAEFAIHKKQGRHDIVHIEILTDTREHVFQSHCGFLQHNFLSFSYLKTLFVVLYEIIRLSVSLKSPYSF